jgi:hypothetical protein
LIDSQQQVKTLFLAQKGVYCRCKPPIPGIERQFSEIAIFGKMEITESVRLLKNETELARVAELFHT